MAQKKKAKTQPKQPVTNEPADPPAVIWVDPFYIGTATRGDGAHCMVANAVREHLDVRRNVEVDVDGQTVEIIDENGKTVFKQKLPQVTTDRIYAWDDHRDPEPFIVELNIDRDTLDKIQGKR